MRFRFTLPPFLIGLFPPLFLFAHNLKEVRPTEIIEPVVIMILSTAVFHWLLSTWLLDRFKAGLTLSLFWILFFSFEHAVNVFGIDGSSIAIAALGAIWIALFVIGTVALVKSRSSLSRLNLVVLVFGLYLVLWQGGAAAWTLYDRGENLPQAQRVRSVDPVRDDLPDIYHIVLDAYGRADILKELYGYDNSAFISFLQDEGFYIADSAYANYGQTLLSLLSMYQMYPLSELPKRYGWNFDNRYGLGEVLEHSEVIKKLQSLGYTTVAFSTGYTETEFQSFDHYYNYEGAFSEFHTLVLSATPLWRVIFPLITPYDLCRGQYEFTLDKLPEVTSIKSPKFVFVHLTLPHPPFVYDSLGEPVDPDIRYSLADGDHLTRLGMTHDKYIEGYINNLKFVNRRMMEILPGIIDQSDRKPIVILQGDHGPGSELHWESLAATNVRERFALLSSYYFPDRDYGMLYESITPINSFRAILNKILGTHDKFADDRSYYSGWLAPLDFAEVTYELHPDWLDSLLAQ